MKVTFTAAGNSQSFRVSDPGNRALLPYWQLYVSGTLGASGTVQVQLSPDDYDAVPDASSRWFNLLTSAISSTPSTSFLSFRARKLRFVFANGDGTTNTIAEIV